MTVQDVLNSRLVWLLRRWGRKIWVRVVGFAGLAVAAIVSAEVLAPYVPAAWAERIGANAVGDILTILASSMLAVTTFSLSIAVSAFAAAANTATPRATALLQEDRTTQNVLATFLGAFLFSLLGLITLRTDIYDDAGEMVLFLATLGVVALVIVALIRWIVLLMSFGRMGNTLDRVEAAATASLARRLGAPCLGAEPWCAPPSWTTPLTAAGAGYVQHVDLPMLSACAAALDMRLHLAALPGSFVYDGAVLLHVAGRAPGEDEIARLRAAFTLGHERTFDQDPRFGIIVLAEIASRALSPAVNDPGTAISVIGRLVRVLSQWPQQAAPVIEFPGVHVAPLDAADVMADAFRPIARDGAALVEVQVRLHKALVALSAIDPAALHGPAVALSRYALARVEQAGLEASELAQVVASAGPLGTMPEASR